MARGRTRRRESKLAAARGVVSGARRPAQGCRAPGPAEGLWLRWRREVAERGAAAVGPPDDASTVAVERKVAEVERFRGQLAPENAALKKGPGMLPSRRGTR